MAQHWCACWTAQHGCVLLVFVWTSRLRGEEPGIDGDAYVALLDDSATPVHQGTRGKSRRMGGKDPGLVFCAPGSPVGQSLAQEVVRATGASCSA